MYPHASTFVTFAIPLLALLVLLLIAIGIARAGAGARAVVGFAVLASLWLGFSGGLAAYGFFARFDAQPPRMALLLLPTFALPLLLGLSNIGNAVALRTPLAALLGFHAFRLPLELIMQQAALQGTMPVQMSMAGVNFDVVTGVSAIFMAVLAARGQAPRWLLFTWNTLGSLLLLTIVVIAIASLPRFAAFGSEPERLNTWVAYFPFVWLPAGLVAAALFGHVVLWRRLLAER